MILGLDSSYDKPTLQQAQAAKAAGYTYWSGYIATKPNVGIAAPWSEADFAIVAQAGLKSIGYCSGNDDPTACAAQAKAWDVLPCLDVERTTRGDGSWVPAWLSAAGCGLYGNAPVFPGRNAAFYVLAAYPGGTQTTTWAPGYPRPSGPCGWQWQGGHIQFGCNVDSTNLDDWFGQLDTAHPAVAVNPNGTAVVFWQGTDGQLWEAQGPAKGPLSGPYPRGMGPLGSAPTVGVDQTGASYTFWKGTDSQLWSTYWNGSGFVGPNSLGMGPLG
jgi:hypothetical protein